MNHGEHITKAQRNLTFQSRLEKWDDRSLDWELVSLFYAALHYLDAYFLRLNPPHTASNHGERKRILKETPLPRSAQEDYRTFEDMSRDARYNFIDLDEQTFEDGRQLAGSLIDRHLEP